MNICYCDKLPEQIKLKKEDIFWLRVSEVSGHGWMDPSLLGIWRGRTSWGKGMAEQSVSSPGNQGGEREREREREKGRLEASATLFN
jgi:hypothetical protein